ncbi:MAG: hypothetical protein WA908_02980 [Pontixanthobacter sp.]
MELIAFVGLFAAAALLEPWWCLVAISVGYLAFMPLGIYRYGKIKRQRATAKQT